MKAFIKKLSVLFAMGALVFGSGLLKEETKVARAAETYSYTFTSKQWATNGTIELNGVSWTLDGDGNYWGYDGTKGHQFGKSSAPCKSMTLSTSDIIGTINEITINTSGASSINASFIVSVGGTQYGSSTKLTTTATEYSFTGNSEGEIKFEYTQTSSKAMYIKSISIKYETSSSGTTPDPEEPEIPDVPDTKGKVTFTAETATGTDETQNISVDNFSISGKFKKLNTSTFFLTSGSGYIYNTTDFGYIKSLTLNYASGGSASATHEVSFDTTAMTSRITQNKNGVSYTASPQGENNSISPTNKYGYFNISVLSNKNLQLSSIEIEYDMSSSEEGETTQVYPTDFTLSETTITLQPNLTNTLSVASYEPGNTNVKNISYSSSNTAAATVDETSGLITGVAVGETTITVTVEGANGTIITKTCHVTVEAATLSSISWTTQKIDFNEGEKFNFGNAVIKAIYSNGEENTIEYTDSNLIIKLDDEVITLEYIMKAEDDGKTLSISYMGKEKSANNLINVTSLEFNTIEAGQYFITAGDYMLPAAEMTNDNPLVVNFDDSLVENVWTFTAVEGKKGQFTISSNENYLYTTDKNDGLRIASSTDLNWEVRLNSDGETYTLTYVSLSRRLAVYDNKDWRTYANTTNGNQSIKLIPYIQKEITSLSYEGTPTKTTYFEGESFDPTGLTINVTYGDGSTGTLAANALTWSPEVLTTGTSSVTGTYGEFSVIVGKIIVNPLPTFGLPTISNTTATGLMPETSGSSTENSYFLAGIVTSVANTEYGNIYFKDAEGVEFYIYGTYLLDGTRYDAMSTKPQVGDTIVVYGAINNFNDSAQIKNAVLVSINKTILEETFALASAVIKADTCKDYKQSAGYKTRYDALSETNKGIFNSIVIASQSEYEGEADTVTLINKLEYMIELNNKPSTTLNSNLLSNLTSSNNTLIVLVVGLLGLTSILGYYFLNKKKYSC